VNKTFQDLGILQDLNEAWMEVGPVIRDYMETGVQVRLLQVSNQLYGSLTFFFTYV